MMKYKSVPCLVLDDWGKETTSDARLSYLYQIINYRYERGLQTIVTTNASSAKGLKNKFNADKIDPLVSRLLGNGEWVNITDTEDYRLKPKTEAVQPELPVSSAASPVVVSATSEPSDEELTEAYVRNVCDVACSCE